MPLVKVKDTKLYFEIYGSELSISGDTVRKKPTIIFIHGGPGFADHTLYVEFWSKLQEIAQVILVDMRGCGRSDLGDSASWNLGQNGIDVFEFANALGIDNPIVAGVSWGGYVALSYAIQFPNHPGGLILCNTEAHVSKELRRDFFGKVSGSKEIADFVWKYDNHWTQELQQEFVEKCMPFYARNSYKREELARCVKNPALWEKFVKEEFYTFDFRPELSKITCPVLHPSGTRDPVHPYPCAQETAELIRNATLHIIEDAADPVYRDKPEETLALINSFIQSI